LKKNRAKKKKRVGKALYADSELFSKRRKALLSRVEALAVPLCEAEGVELIFAEYQMEPRGRVLRLYIDKPGGVTIDDCADISRLVSDLLDIHLEHEDSYQLEVSSPGIDRPLGKAADFQRFKGHEVCVRTARPINGRKNFTGRLTAFENEKASLDVDGGIVDIDFSNIAKARLINYHGEG